MHLPYLIEAGAIAVAIGLLVGGTGAARATPPPAAQCVSASESEIATLSQSWSQALAAGRLDEVAAFYADNAVLMAEGMADPIAGRRQIRDWLARLAGRHAEPQVSMRSVVTACGLASEMAATKFKVTGVRKGTRMFIGGRSSTVWSHDGTRWRIVQQSLPTMLVPNRAR